MRHGFLLIVLILVTIFSKAQERLIKGVVKNAETNEAVDQASIKYGNTGVLTNKNGEFEVKTEDSISKFYISGTGFQSDSISLHSATSFYTIFLKQSFNRLDEIVVSGTMKAVSRLASPIPV